jgi:hypothetical protein
MKTLTFSTLPVLVAYAAQPHLSKLQRRGMPKLQESSLP